MAEKTISKRHAAAARINGAKGGRPSMAEVRDREAQGHEDGMPRWPEDSIERIGLPPADPMEMIRWYSRMNAELALLVIRGLATRDMANTLRAIIIAAARLNPPDLQFAADERLRNADREMKAPGTGPELEDVDDADQDGSIRRGPFTHGGGR